MITFFSRRIADFLYHKNIIAEDDVEICQYGYEVLFFNLFNALLVLLMGFALHKLLYSVIFFLIFAVLRQYCGGYHAKSTVICTFVYLSAYLFVILIASSRFIGEIYTLSTNVVLSAAYITTIVLYAPIENPNKPIDKEEKKKYRNISVMLGLLIIMAGLIAYHINVHISAVIALTLFVVMLFMLVGMYGGKEGETNEKGTEYDR